MLLPFLALSVERLEHNGNRAEDASVDAGSQHQEDAQGEVVKGADRPYINTEEHKHQVVEGVHVLPLPIDLVEVDGLVVVERIPNLAISGVLVSPVDEEPDAGGEVEVEEDPEDQLE